MVSLDMLLLFARPLRGCWRCSGAWWGEMTAGVLFALGLVLCTQPALAFEVPPNDGFVTDAVGILSPAEDAEIEEILSAYRAQTSNEIAVLIVPTLHGEPIADVAVQVGRAWGVGGGDRDNGILILIAYDDREVFIATGYGLEGPVPDIVAKGIVDAEMVPRFREGEYARGIRAAIDALQKHIGGEYTADRYAPSASGDVLPFVLLMAFVVFDLLAALFARTRSWWLGGIVGVILGVFLAIIAGWWLAIPFLGILGLLFDFLVSKTGYRRGHARLFLSGMGGRRGRGGFGGFSGGSFGGGGAGGKW